MSTNPSAGVERRRKPDAVRRDALAAGRGLLLEGGPKALTLKAVGAALGMSHANVIHHFGSAEAFQAQLKDLMVQDLTREITAIVADAAGTPDTASIVAKVFDAYGRGGIAILMAWSRVTGTPYDEAAIAATLRELVDALTPRIEGPDAQARAKEIVAMVTLLAFADGLIGTALTQAVGGKREAVRSLTVRLVDELAGDRQRVGEHRSSTIDRSE